MEYLVRYPALGVVIAVVAISFLPARWKSIAGLLIILVNVMSTTIAVIQGLGDSDEIIMHAGWIFGNIKLVVDPLSAWFVVVINVTCVLGAWYGTQYMKAYLDQEHNLSIHWIVLVLFHYSMILVVTVQNGLAFLVVWEVMSVSSFLLVIFDHSRMTTLKAGMNYLVQTHIGAAFLMIAFVWMWADTDTHDFSSLTSLFAAKDGFWLFLFFLVGFGIKAGFVPLHTWLPHAHPAAPSHVSGLMSGVMVSMGIYGLMRVMFLNTNLLTIGLIIFVISLLTTCYGILRAALHRDYKRVLAFSTIENIGIIGMGIGLGIFGKYAGNQSLLFLGFGGALLHTLNHSLYKPLLFFCSGNIYRTTHSRNMEELGGLIHKVPYTGVLFLIGAIAIAGLPPFNGFASKFLLFKGMFDVMDQGNFDFNVLMITGVVGLVIAGGLSLLTFTRMFSIIFLGAPRNPSRFQPPEYFNAGHIPLIVATFLMVVIAMSPDVVLNPIGMIVSMFDESGHAPIPANLQSVLTHIGQASLLFILLGGALLGLRRIVTAKRPADLGPTWGCGYPKSSPRMQYTGKSFSKSLAKLIGVVSGEEKRYTEIPTNTVFPSVRSYQSNYAEFFEKNVIDKIVNAVLTFMNRFSFIHNGRVQYYILYGMLFILILLTATWMQAI
jgi:hydrogenase-4 component B